MALSNGSVAEDQPVGTVAAVLRAVDPEGGDLFKYTPQAAALFDYEARWLSGSGHGLADPQVTHPETTFAAAVHHLVVAAVVTGGPVHALIIDMQVPTAASAGVPSAQCQVGMDNEPDIGE